MKGRKDDLLRIRKALIKLKGQHLKLDRYQVIGKINNHLFARHLRFTDILCHLNLDETNTKF